MATITAYYQPEKRRLTDSAGNAVSPMGAPFAFYTEKPDVVIYMRTANGTAMPLPSGSGITWTADLCEDFDPTTSSLVHVASSAFTSTSDDYLAGILKFPLFTGTAQLYAAIGAKASIPSVLFVRATAIESIDGVSCVVTKFAAAIPLGIYNIANPSGFLPSVTSDLDMLLDQLDEVYIRLLPVEDSLWTAEDLLTNSIRSASSSMTGTDLIYAFCTLIKDLKGRGIL